MNGQNFLVDMDGLTSKYGFYQNFYLEAESPKHAEVLVIQKIRGNDDLRTITKNIKEDPPVINLDEVLEIETFDGLDAMESGKAWYRERKWWQFWK